MWMVCPPLKVSPYAYVCVGGKGGSLKFHSGNLLEQHPSCPNSLMIFEISPNSGGRAPQTPYLISFYEYSIRNPGECLSARILHALKIGRFVPFWIVWRILGAWSPTFEFCQGGGAVGCSSGPAVEYTSICTISDST